MIYGTDQMTMTGGVPVFTTTDACTLLRKYKGVTRSLLSLSIVSLVVEYDVAIVVARVQFPDDAFF